MATSKQYLERSQVSNSDGRRCSFSLLTAVLAPANQTGGWIILLESPVNPLCTCTQPKTESTSNSQQTEFTGNNNLTEQPNKMPPTLRNRRNVDTTPRVVEVNTDEEDEITRTTEQQRERNRAEKEEKRKTKKYKDDEDEDEEGFYISLLDVIRIILTLIALSSGLSYYTTSGESFIWGYEKQRPWWMRYNDIKQFLV